MEKLAYCSFCEAEFYGEDDANCPYCGHKSGGEPKMYWKIEDEDTDDESTESEN